MINYSVEQIAQLRKSQLCMYCLDGVPLQNGEHDLFGVEKVSCVEHRAQHPCVHPSVETQGSEEEFTGHQEPLIDPTGD